MSDSTSFSVSLPQPADDSRPLPEIIAEFYGFPLAYVDHEDGERYYAVQDWIAGVAKSSEPRTFWTAMKRRLKKVGIEMSTRCTQLPYLASDGKRYKMDHANAETLYLITQRMDANTGLRDKVLQYLARSGVVIDEMRIDPDKAIEAVITEYQRRGKTDSWIATRIRSIHVRNKFTIAFKNSQTKPPERKHYGIITDTMRMGVWKRKTQEILKQRGLSKQTNLRDHLSEIALTFEMLAEQMSTYRFDEKRNLDFDDANDIVRRNSEVVGKYADDASRELGIDIATDKKLLPPGAKQ